MLASEASQGLRAYGQDLFSVAQSLIDLGTIRRYEGRYQEADALIQEGTDVYAKAQGRRQPQRDLRVGDAGHIALLPT